MMKTLKNEVSPDQEVIEMMMVKGEADLFYFASEICEFGYNDDPNGPRITEDQRELAEWLQNDDRNWLSWILTPRDTLKSTMLQAYVLWKLVKNPNYRVLLYGEVHEQGKKRLGVIKRIIESGETFRDCYGDLDGSKKGYTWNDNVLVLANRDKAAIREGSIETAGLDVVVNARHFDEIIPDDLHSQKNTKTKDQVENVKENVQLLLPLKSKGGRITGAGVFWSDNDVHTWIVDELKADTYKQSIYVEDDPDKGLRYPHVLPESEIKIKKDGMRSDLFDCHYMMDPVPKASQKFKKEYFTILPRTSITDLRIFLLIDPAGDPTSNITAKKDSDNTGMVVWGVTSAQDLFGLDFWRGKVEPTEAIEMAIMFILRHRPHIVGVEKSGLGNMSFYLKEELRKRGMFAIVEDLHPHGRSQYQRVMELEPLARRRKMFLAQEAQMRDEFVEEATRYNKGKFDDLIDPTAYILDLLRKYGTPVNDSDQEEIPIALAELDERSRQHWMGQRRKKAAQDQGWVEEFV